MKLKKAAIGVAAVAGVPAFAPAARAQTTPTQEQIAAAVALVTSEAFKAAYAAAMAAGTVPKYTKRDVPFRCPDEVGEKPAGLTMETFENSANIWAHCDSRVQVRVRAKYVGADGKISLDTALDTGERFNFTEGDVGHRLAYACVFAQKAGSTWAFRAEWDKGTWTTRDEWVAAKRTSGCDVD